MLERVLLPYVVTSIVSVLLALACWRWPRLGRFALVLLFTSAAVFNAATALRSPGVYVTGFAPQAAAIVRRFIVGPFARNPAAWVLAIAAGQVACAGLVLASGRARLVGLFGMFFFLVAISGLGPGAAFPANLILAAGPALLLVRPPPQLVGLGAPYLVRVK